ncbi:MAG: HAD family hydrolase [Bryobacterales bacterium]|jgi:putative hydrolase of the HAD superfamily|nr:HAD family hydrolase [Bryobacterales bacterium]
MKNGYRHLIIDADDTLWENNVYFEQAFQRFAAFLNHSALDMPTVRRRLDEIEHVNRVRHGYGARQFGRNMQECFAALCERSWTDADLETVMDIALDIMAQPLVMIDGVQQTLAYLQPRYHLTLFTKGDPAEQRGKVRASGLEDFFEEVVVVKEKDESAYHALLERRGARKEESWMVGNSPKSDINPPLAIGMNAAYIPHPRNWHLEEEPLIPGKGKLLELSAFTELRRHF